MRRLRTLAAALLLAGPLTLAGCAPSLSAPAAPQEEQPGGPLLETARSAAEEPARDTAITIWHRMELGRLEAGSYTSNVLEDLTDLPRGIAFFMDAFPGESFELRVLDDAVPDVYWLVTPAGISRHEA
ncbi:MAG TPA: hypothetical protein VK092_01490 [Deinococcales bacterium]|nr:hypothetical protein [Deinococcales bacterium]